jgi:hypothetical protein
LHRAQVGLVRDGQFATGVPDRWWPRPGCLTIAEREEILVGIHAGDSLPVIARRLERAPSTISREVAANGGWDASSAWTGHQRAEREARRPCALTWACSSHGWSREQIPAYG